MEMTKDMATFIGLLYTDGCLSPHGVRSWRLYFSNKSLAAIDLFRSCVTSVFDINPTRVRVYERDRDVYAAIVTSRSIGDALTERFGTFRTLRYDDGAYPKASLPVEELIRAKMVQPFLRAAFSMDGGVKFYPVVSRVKRTRWLERKVFLSCQHPTLLQQYSILLESIGLRPIVHEAQGEISLLQRANFTRFAERVNFLDGVAVTHDSPYWLNVEKKHVLKELVASYGNAAHYLRLPNFHSKDIVRSYGRS
jgi:hypothetical protein